MKTLRIILGVALTAPLAVTAAVRADNKTQPAQTSPDRTSPDTTSPDTTSSDKTSSSDRKRDVTIDQLPRAVKATVQRETKGKNIASITKSTDSNGTAAYEVKVRDGAMETTIDVANNGKVTSRKTGAASDSSSSTTPGANPTDQNPPRANSPHATSPSSPPPSSPPPSSDTPDDRKQDQRPNPPGH